MKQGKLQTFAKSTALYFVGNVLNKVILFFLFPLHTAYINPKDYGTYDLTISIITFFCSVLFLDIWDGIMRFALERKDTDGKMNVICSGETIFIVSTAIYLVFVISAGVIFKIQYFELICVYGILSNAVVLFAYVARTLSKTYLFVLGGLVGSLVTLGANVILLVGFKMNYSSLYISAILGNIANIIVLNCKGPLFTFKFKKYFDNKLTKSLFLFSLPLCVNSVAYWFLTGFNRVVIASELSTFDNGMLAAAAKFTSVLALVTSCFNMAWKELSYSQEFSDIKGASLFYTRAINLFIKFLSLSVLGLIPLVFLTYSLLVNEQYAAAKMMVPISLLGALMSTLSGFLGNVFGALKDTKVLFYSTLLGSIVNVIVIYTLIGTQGAQAANIALLCGYTVTVLFRLFLIKKRINISLNLKSISFFICTIIVYMAIYQFCDTRVNIFALIVAGIIALFSLKNELKLLRPL